MLKGIFAEMNMAQPVSAACEADSFHS